MSRACWHRSVELLLLAAAIQTPQAIDAQYLPPVWRSVTPSMPTVLGSYPLPVDTGRVGDYAVAGALIGGAVTGVLFGGLVASFCGYEEPDPSFGTCTYRTIAGAVMGAIPGFMIGGLIGSAIKKPRRRVAVAAPPHHALLSGPADSTRAR